MAKTVQSNEKVKASVENNALTVREGFSVVREGLDCNGIVDLATASERITFADQISDTTAKLSVKALALVRDREYWKLAKYPISSGKGYRGFSSFTDWATKTYGVSKGTISEKVRVAPLLDDSGFTSIFYEPAKGAPDFSLSALRILANKISVEVPSGKILKNGNEEIIKVADTEAIASLVNSGTITPYMSTREILKVLKSKDIDEPTTTEIDASEIDDSEIDSATEDGAKNEHDNIAISLTRKEWNIIANLLSDICNDTLKAFAEDIRKRIM